MYGNNNKNWNEIVWSLRRHISPYTSDTDNAHPPTNDRGVLTGVYKSQLRPFGILIVIYRTSTMKDCHWKSFLVFAVLQSAVAFKIPGNIAVGRGPNVWARLYLKYLLSGYFNRYTFRKYSFMRIPLVLFVSIFKES